ncbi:hypothetical protein FQN60_014366 [Etheostoma spectabile]|uniref:RING-type E3 ubiquitin transferase n=1 Tax=Etheostoma spectabile TaxID=54343 RepID=A0A5J5D6T0_9PERO|nr:hypothetical protein FQN60_014366 [Etheostoma spectabile]
MEAMEVDSPGHLQGGGDRQPEVAAAAADANAPHVISDSGSSTEVDEDDEDDNERGQTAARVPPRLPATWAFSQRAGLRVHYPSQTAAPSRGFPDFLLRAPAASVAQPESGSTTEVSESDEEEGEEGVNGEASAAAPEPVVPAEEGEGDICSICFEAWTTAGEHRLSALRCGHLFGFTCIQRWLKAQGPAAKSLEQEQSLRRKAELESAQYKLKLQVVTNKYGQAQQELQELRALMAQAGRSSVPSSSSSTSSASTSLLLGLCQRADGSRTAQYSFSKAVLVSQAGSCRLTVTKVFSVSHSHWPPFLSPPAGCGVKKVSVVNMKASQYVPIHSKQIRGLSFNRQNDSLLLSAALDNTIKLTSLLTNTVVQTYNAGKPVWSCCWCLDNSNYVYAGLSNGSVLIYDTRDTSTHVQELQPLRSRCPVASLCYVPRAASSSFPCGGLIAGSLEGGCFWEQVNETTYRPHVLPLETAGCTDIQPFS